mmetsp:Transcript_27061/g.51266  ORF Transcript_27061/g.51266 Transcript_27061/m.51266 type:complete len:326 (-) Transcript_27061:1350-2327(-)
MQSTTATMRGEMVSFALPPMLPPVSESSCCSACCWPVAESLGFPQMILLCLQYSSSSLTRGMMPKFFLRSSWFPSWPAQSRPMILTASALKLSGEPWSLKRWSMILMASIWASSSCKPGSPTTLMSSMRAPWMSSRLSGLSSHQSRKRRTTMGPPKALNLSGARGAKFKSTIKACDCKTRSCVLGMREMRDCAPAAPMVTGTWSLSSTPSPSSSTMSSSLTSGSVYMASSGIPSPSRSVSKYIRSVSIRGLSTHTFSMSAFALLSSERSPQRILLSSRSAGETVAKLWGSTWLTSSPSPSGSVPTSATVAYTHMTLTKEEERKKL